jgi:hypothetical protein
LPFGWCFPEPVSPRITSGQIFRFLLYRNTDVAKKWMMIAGANTPAMIKTMTTEVESRNLIAASIHPCADSFRTGMPPRPRVLAFAPS